MGRYAFFSTGFEYKFRFGVQPSEDITVFGGKITDENYHHGYFTQKWTTNDTSLVKQKLDSLLEWIGEDPVPFEEYEKTLDGTHTLAYKLYNLYESHDSEEIVARYILGCVIYHQLLYKEVLEVEYEP
jgi:hypothetical protein